LSLADSLAIIGVSRVLPAAIYRSGETCLSAYQSEDRDRSSEFRRESPSGKYFAEFRLSSLLAYGLVTSDRRPNHLNNLQQLRSQIERY
jgi:hypothetical protein